MTKEFSNGLMALTEAFKSIAKQASDNMKDLSKIVFYPFAEEAKRIGEEFGKFIDEILLETNNAGLILKKYGWLIPPSMDLRVSAIITEIGGKAGNHRKEINKIFVDYYQRDNYKEIEQMITKWGSNKLYKKRIKILRDCLLLLQLPKKKSKINYSNIIIPTLIAQIDGTLTDYSIIKGFDIKKYPEYKIPKKLDQYREDVIKNIKTSDSFVVLDDLFKNIIIDTLFGTAFMGHGPKTGHLSTRFYRHKIMHGEYISYGSIYNVLRAFLILDYISELK